MSANFFPTRQIDVTDEGEQQVQKSKSKDLREGKGKKDEKSLLGTQDEGHEGSE